MTEQIIESGLIIKQKPSQVSSGKTYRIGIVIPVLNYFEGAVDVIASIRSKHIISTYIMPQYRIREPLAAAWNHGAQRAFLEGCDFAIVTNDDIMFSPECIDNMIAEYERLNPEGVIMITPNNIMGQMPDKYSILDYYIPKDQITSITDHPNFSCFLIYKDFFEQMGTFDENFNPAWCEDQDMHQRIWLAGKRAINTTACPTIHIGSVTTLRLEVADSTASIAHFIHKWGSQNTTPPQAYTHPYNDESKSYKEW